MHTSQRCNITQVQTPTEVSRSPMCIAERKNPQRSTIHRVAKMIEVQGLQLELEVWLQCPERVVPLA